MITSYARRLEAIEGFLRFLGAGLLSHDKISLFLQNSYAWAGNC